MLRSGVAWNTNTDTSSRARGALDLKGAAQVDDALTHRLISSSSRIRFTFAAFRVHQKALPFGAKLSILSDFSAILCLRSEYGMKEGRSESTASFNMHKSSAGMVIFATQAFSRTPSAIPLPQR